MLFRFTFVLVTFLAFSVIFIGCNDNPTNSLSGEHLRMSHSYNTFHDSHEKRIENDLNKFFLDSYEEISDEIYEKSKQNSFDLSKDAHDVILKSIEIQFYIDAKKNFSTKFSNDIANEYKIYLEDINISDNNKRNSLLNDDEKNSLLTLVNNYHTNNQNNLLIMYDEIIQDTKDSFLNVPLKNTSKKINIFEEANKTATFQNKMKTYFKNFNAESDYNSSTHTPPTNHHIHNKLEITNTFDGKKLYQHKPVYENGEISRIDDLPAKDIDFTPMDNSNPKDSQYYISASADVNGDAHHSLIIFKEYKNGYFYPYEIDYNGIIKKDISIKKMKNLTDITAADIDNDGRDEIILAQGSPYNRISIFDDASQNFKPITEYNFFNVITDNGIIRLASGDVDADGYAEFAAVSYNEKETAWSSQLYMWNIDNDSPSLLKQKFEYTFENKMPIDIVFSDLNSVDKIDLFAVELSNKSEKKSQGYHQPKQSGSDDYCMYFMKSTNYLNVYEFAYNFSTDDFDKIEKKITIDNYTYDKKYNNGTECLKGSDGYCILDDNGNSIQKDGVNCIFTGCTCDVDIIKYLPAYHLYGANDKTHKPVYATAYHESLNMPSMLDIDGFAYNYAGSGNDTILKPASNYPVTNKHKYDKDSHTYTPVRSNSDENKARRYVTHMIEGQRKYEESAIPHAIASESNTHKNQRGYVYRKYNEDFPHIRRLSTYAYDTKILKFKHHHILYSKPIIAYILTPPPPVGKKVTMSYSLSHCKAKETEDTKLNGPVVGASIGFGVSENVLVADSEQSVALNFETVQSSGSVDERKKEICVEKGHSLSSENDYIVYYYTNLLDSYQYEIIQDFIHPDNVGKTITINQKRLNNSLAYEAQTGVKDLYEKLDAIGIEPEVDIRSLITHKEGNISSYYTQTGFNNIVDKPSANLSEDFDYTHIWYTKENVLIPNSGGVENSYTKTVSKTYGTEEHDSYKASVEFKSEFKEGFIVSATEELSLELGWEWSFYHEKLTENSTETSYTLEIEGDENVDELDYSYIGIFSYIARPNGKKCYNKNSIPINREDFSDLNKDKEIDCKPPVLVIDYWLTNNSQSD